MQDDNTDQTSEVHDTASGGPTALTLVCPIRGQLKVRAKTKDGLRPSEEALRIEAIRHLLALGYEKEYILVEPVVRKIGNQGRNSLRADLAVTDIPATQVKALPVEDRVNHCTILVEVKRDNAKAKKVKETQVEPLLAFGPPGCLAVYWDPIEQRVFWHDQKKQTQEGYLAALPGKGEKFGGNPKLTYERLQETANLRELFDRVEDNLHAHGVDKQARYDFMLQLLLAKLFDERSGFSQPTKPLRIQDPKAIGLDLSVAKDQFENLLSDVAAFYANDLPKELETTVGVSREALADALEVVAPRRISHSSRSALQDFFMKFAKDTFKWDLAQYFTPTPLTEFIVDLANPQALELVKDPALGSGDFLMAAHERDLGARGKPKLYGADTSETAAQVAELNKILHGIDQCEIRIEDSLASIDGAFSVRTTKIKGVEQVNGRYHLLICNPPFGSRITIKDPTVLAKYDLGHEWVRDAQGEWKRTDKLLKSQETGILFVEACVRQALRDGGRVAIILPNGYLGNRTPRFQHLREWMLRHTRVAAIVSFPRFTFKNSGADVSASVVVMERREAPLATSAASDDYPVAIELIERVGWQAGQRNGPKTWVRDEEDGSVILDQNGEPTLDADFQDVLSRVRSSAAGSRFGWLAGEAPASISPGHSVPVSQIIADPQRCLDPKRLSGKFLDVRRTIEADPYFLLGDKVQFVAPLTSAQVRQRTPGNLYRYVEIQDCGPGLYSSVEMRGWQLPDRARHTADAGDVFVGGIWGSVSKWFLAADEPNLVVTNGFYRLKVEEDYLLDVVAGLCSEAYAVQARALSRGSDGLAEVTAEDLMSIVLPRVTDPNTRRELQPYIDQLKAGHTSVKSAVEDMIAAGKLPHPPVSARSSHVVLV